MISKRTQNAVSIMINIAQQQGKRATVKALAKRTGLSGKYCGQIGTRLRTAGLVASTRGSRGGYVLVRPRVTAGDVVRAVDEPDRPSDDPRDQPIEAVFGPVRTAVWKTLDGITLETVEQKRSPSVARRRRQQNLCHRLGTIDTGKPRLILKPMASGPS